MKVEMDELRRRNRILEVGQDAETIEVDQPNDIKKQSSNTKVNMITNYMFIV